MQQMMNEKTKYRLAESMKQLVKKKRIDAITVAEIIQLADVSRPTFYRHFRDKYDLVNWFFQKLCDRSFMQMGVSLTITKALNRKFEFLRGEKDFFAAAFSCRSQNNLMDYDYHCIYQFYSDFIKKGGEADFTPEIRFLLEMYCHGSIIMTAQWAVSGMTTPPDKMAAFLVEALPPKLREKFISLS